MAKMIHLTVVRKMLNSGGSFDLKYWKKDGSIVQADNVVCTSTNFHNNTANIKHLNSGEFRKVKMIALFEINGIEIFI